MWNFLGKEKYMKKLMYEITCSDIRMTELKLKRIRIYRKRLLEEKPLVFNKKKFDAWSEKMAKLNCEEDIILKELQNAYEDLEDFL